MKLFLFAFVASALITTASAFAAFPGGGGDEPLTGGSPVNSRTEPGWARFEESTSHMLRVQKARDRSAYNEALTRYYSSMGYDYAHPVINYGTGTVPFPISHRYVWRRGYAIYPPLSY
jgi:hypothetical protein